MSKQTALQQAIEHMKAEFEELDMTNHPTTNAVIRSLEKYLPAEQQQIEQAYNDGCVYGHINDSETYFATTYGAEKVQGDDEMSDEEYVKSVYPDAIIRRRYSAAFDTDYYFLVNSNNANEIVISGEVEDIESAWSDAANRIWEKK